MASKNKRSHRLLPTAALTLRGLSISKGPFQHKRKRHLPFSFPTRRYAPNQKFNTWRSERCLFEFTHVVAQILIRMAQKACLSDIFRITAKEFENSVATAFYEDAVLVQTATYKEVQELSLQISNVLRKKCGISPKTLGLYMDTCLELPPVILGILLSGHSFAPINLFSPTNVIKQFIRLANIKYILTNENWVEQVSKLFSEYGKTIQRHLLLNDVNTFTNNLMLCSIEEQTMSTVSKCFEKKQTDHYFQPAYVLCTSGTTGQPKIVTVPHSSIVPNIFHFRKLFSVCRSDKISMLSPLTFDPSIVEMFLALTSGAALVLFSGSVKRNPHLLLDTLFNVAGVTIMQATPSLLYQFDATDLQNIMFSPSSSLKLLSIGGEQCPTYKTIKKWIHPKILHPSFRIFNLYGITEVSVWSTYFELPPEKIMNGTDERIPIGYPMIETSLALVSMDQTRILYTFEQSLTDNKISCIDAKVCCKQHNNKNAETEGYVWLGSSTRVCDIRCSNFEKSKLHEISFHELIGADKIPSNMVYRMTGDIVSFKLHVTSNNLLPECDQLYYVGRSDYQIKRNGKRMNLLHVKRVLENCVHVNVAHVTQITVTAVRKNNSFLVAFVVLEEFCEPSIESALDVVEKHAIACLESHSVPDKFLHIRKIPMTAHEKVDENVLRDIYHSRRYIKDKLSFKDIVCKTNSGHTTKELVKSTLIYCWNTCLKFENTPNLENLNSEIMSQNFIKLGGNSLLAVKFLTLVENLLPSKVKLPDLLTVLMQKTFSDLCLYVLTALETQFQNYTPKSLKRHCEDCVAKITPKKYTMVKNSDCSDYLTLSRGGKICNSLLLQPTIAHGTSHYSGIPNVQINNGWSYNTGKCIDASPLLVVSLHGKGEKAVIGWFLYLFHVLSKYFEQICFVFVI